MDVQSAGAGLHQRNNRDGSGLCGRPGKPGDRQCQGAHPGPDEADRGELAIVLSILKSVVEGVTFRRARAARLALELTRIERRLRLINGRLRGTGFCEKEPSHRKATDDDGCLAEKNDGSRGVRTRAWLELKRAW